MGTGIAPSSHSDTPSLCYPTTLIPLSVYQDRQFSANSFPIVTRRSPTSSGTGKITCSTDVRSRSELFLLAETNLPPFIEFALRAIGWRGGVLRAVQTAWSSREPLEEFIFTLGKAGVPMAEAYLIWQLLEREEAVGSGRADRE